jgi:hypothetical protein
LAGVRRLIGKTEMIGVEDVDGWIVYAPLEALGGEGRGC